MTVNDLWEAARLAARELSSGRTAPDPQAASELIDALADAALGGIYLPDQVETAIDRLVDDVLQPADTWWEEDR